MLYIYVKEEVECYFFFEIFNDTPIVLFRKPLMVPGVGDEAAAADSHGLAVVSISIGATSEGFV